jgi:hypothetical protein
MMNEKLGQLEQLQIAMNFKLGALEIPLVISVASSRQCLQLC